MGIPSWQAAGVHCSLQFPNVLRTGSKRDVEGSGSGIKNSLAMMVPCGRASFSASVWVPGTRH